MRSLPESDSERQRVKRWVPGSGGKRNGPLVFKGDRVHRMTGAAGGGSHLSKSKSICQGLAGPWPGASHQSASLCPEAGGEAPRPLRSWAPHALGVGSWGASAPLGRERKGKLSRALGRRERPTAESGGTWLPKQTRPPRAHSGGSKAGSTQPVAESLLPFNSVCKCPMCEG